jgi:hypothetical protein
VHPERIVPVARDDGSAAVQHRRHVPPAVPRQLLTVPAHQLDHRIRPYRRVTRLRRFRYIVPLVVDVKISNPRRRLFIALCFTKNL